MSKNAESNIKDSESSLASGCKYPHIKVRLTGSDGNAFAVLGKVRDALRKAKVQEEEIQKFSDEATSGDYNNLLATCMKWVTVS